MTRRSLLGLGLCSVLGMSACAGGPEPAAVAPAAAAYAAGAGWRELPGSPLSPRSHALGLWTGHEVLILGGSDAAPCPPAADCAGDPDPLTDAAAVDPATGAWRPLADLPVGLPWAQGVVVGGTAYVLGTRPGGSEPVLLAYRIAQDRWEQLPLPGGRDGMHLVAAGEQLVAVNGSHEHGRGPDYRLDPAGGGWRELPPDPLGAGFGRTMAWTGRELVLFDRELVPDPGSAKPSLVRAAAFDPAAGTWRRLPDSPQLGAYWWLAVDGKLVNPELGGADGGQVGNWGRRFPNGGVLDPVTGVWSALPNPPTGHDFGGSAYSATGAVYSGTPGPVLDTATGAWHTIPRFPHGEIRDHAAVAAGNRLLVFGGATWAGNTGTHTAATWLWTPTP